MPDMRFAPPRQLRIADRADGLNPERVRSYNERLILSLLLQSDGISRLEIGERTRLSAQTISVIVRSLEQEGLVVNGEALRGRVGPPTIPILLNREGAYALGISLGPSRIDIVLIDFLGRVHQHFKLPGNGKIDEDTSRSVSTAAKEMLQTLSEPTRARVAGVGLCLPSRPGPLLDAGSRMHAELEASIGLPVFVQDDITAAAGAEMMFGATKTTSDYLFFFVAEVLYSRLVLNNHIYLGNYSVAPRFHDIGAISLMEGASKGPNGSAAPLDAALETCVYRLRELTSVLAQFVDFKTVVIGGETTDLVTTALRDAMHRAIPTIKVVTGNTTIHARAIGAGSLPFVARFTVQH
jgi:predicted NBD/HSP70 family sugar kinase